MDEQPTILPAGESVATILGKIGGAVVGLSAIAYFVGWGEAWSYYDALGAPWVLKSLSATRFLLESANLITFLGLFALMAVVTLLEGMWPLKYAFRVSNSFVFLGGALTLMGVLLSRRVTPTATFWLSQSAVLLFALATALTFAEVVVSLRTEGLKWFSQKPRYWYVFSLLLVGLWQAPSTAGIALAARNANPELSRLPKMFPESKPDSGWLLVTPLDGKFVLMKPAIRRESRAFRVVDSLEGWTIGPSR
jgi:hypothetical protein